MSVEPGWINITIDENGPFMGDSDFAFEITDTGPLLRVLSRRQNPNWWNSLPKSRWLMEARAEGNFGESGACDVCGHYAGLTHAHHIIPLAEQHERGFERPDHTHIWLCPNHHALVHALLRERGSAERFQARHALSEQEMTAIKILAEWSWESPE